MRTRRLVRVVPAGLLAVALLAACGDETSDGSSPSETATDSASPTLTSRLLGGDPLNVDEATAALLAQGNLPTFDALGPSTPGDVEESDGTESDEAEGDEATGCENEEAFEDRFDRGGLATTRTDTAYLFADDARLLIVTSLVTSFTDDGQSEAAFAEVQADFGSCTHYEDTTDAGETTVVDIENNTDTATDEVDEQLNLVGTGLWTAPDFDDVDMGFGLSLARVANNVTLTQVISIGVAEDNALLEPYTEIAVDRLVAVANGETPEDVAGPVPTPIPASFLPVPPKPSTYESYFDLDPRFSLPD
jgi:hypothetical protein